MTLDPATARCAHDLTALLANPEKTSVSVAPELVRASLAFERLRVLHAPLLRVLRSFPLESWQALPAATLAAAVNAQAALGVEDASLLQRWSEALDEERIAPLHAQALANLVWAAGTLRMRAERGLYHRLSAAVARADMQKLGFDQLGKVAWGLSRLVPEGAAAKDCAAEPWLQAIASALRRIRPGTGRGLTQLLQAFAATGYADGAQQLLRQLDGRAPGKDAYAMLLQEAAGPRRRAELLEEMAGGAGACAGLRAAALNSAILCRLKDGDSTGARRLLREMAASKLWNPVTYHLAAKVAASDGAPAEPGQPPHPGMLDPGEGAHKYVRAVYHALGLAKPGDAAALMAGLEDYSRKRGWLKFGAAYEKGAAIDAALRGLRRRAVAVEYGTFLGYSALRMALLLGPGSRIISFEVDPEVACLAMNMIAFADVDTEIDVWIGHCEQLSPRLVDVLGKRSVDVVYMDHNQITYHQDLAQLEALGVLADGALLAATQGLKPGAPLLLWRLAEAQRAGRCRLCLVSAPDCGCPLMEEYVVLATLAAPGDARPWEPREAPYDLALLAVECNLMRWRTSRGLVDEKRWNGFVQYVRRSLTKIAGLAATCDAWVDPQARDRARQLQYQRMDY